MSKWRGWSILVSIILILSLVGYGIYRLGKSHSMPITKTEFRDVPVIETVRKIKTVKVPGPKEVITIEKIKIVEKLKLPDWVKNDKDQQVIATAEIPAYEGKTDTVAVLNTQDGSSRIIAKQRPLPFFGTPNEWEVGAGYGIDTHGQQMAQVEARWTFLRVGDIRIAGYVEGNSRPEAKAMIKAYIRR